MVVQRLLRRARDGRRAVAAIVAVALLGLSALAATDTYVVRKGDTLAAIARKHGTTVAVLAAANGISDPDRILIGMRLLLGAPAAAAPVATTYTVQRGDTMASIARKHGTTVSALAAANGIADPNRVQAGRTLSIPGVVAAAAGGGGVHVVQAGETLAGIARQHGTTVATLAAANGLASPYRIYVGSRLLLAPAGPTAVGLAVCPVPGARFMNDWGFPRSGGRFHEGNDLFAPHGTPVLAPHGGVLTQVTGSIGGHQFKLVTPNGTLYIGSHMAGFGKAGQVVAGDVIGYVGDTGNARGATPHLHFEVHPNGGAAVNPNPLLAGVC